VKSIEILALLSFVLLLANGISACGRNEMQSTPKVVTSVMNATPVVPTPMVCTPLPTDNFLSVEPISTSAVRISGEDFEPGKPLTIELTSEATTEGHHRQMHRWHSGVYVEPDGCFTVIVDGLSPLSGAITNTWRVSLLHDDSVVCQTVTLPSEE